MSIFRKKSLEEQDPQLIAITNMLTARMVQELTEENLLIPVIFTPSQLGYLTGYLQTKVFPRGK